MVFGFIHGILPDGAANEINFKKASPTEFNYTYTITTKFPQVIVESISNIITARLGTYSTNLHNSRELGHYLAKRREHATNPK
jgi:hypothetical protein